MFKMFKFTIRELLLLTLVVALGVAWGLDRWRQVERYNRLEYAIKNSQGRGVPFDSSGEVMVSLYYPKYLPVAPPNSASPALNPPKP